MYITIYGDCIETLSGQQGQREMADPGEGVEHQEDGGRRLLPRTAARGRGGGAVEARHHEHQHVHQEREPAHCVQGRQEWHPGVGRRNSALSPTRLLLHFYYNDLLLLSG